MRIFRIIAICIILLALVELFFVRSLLQHFGAGGPQQITSIHEVHYQTGLVFPSSATVISAEYHANGYFIAKIVIAAKDRAAFFNQPLLKGRSKAITTEELHDSLTQNSNISRLFKQKHWLPTNSQRWLIAEADFGSPSTIYANLDNESVVTIYIGKTIY
jgi:hypothetical protein